MIAPERLLNARAASTTALPINADGSIVHEGDEGEQALPPSPVFASPIFRLYIRTEARFALPMLLGLSWQLSYPGWATNNVADA